MAHRTHTTFPIIMNTPLGHLKFRQSFTYNAKTDVAGPDPFTGHISYAQPDPDTPGNTVMLPPVPRDFLQDVIEHRAEAPAATIDSGQEGHMLKDPAFDPVPIVESPTSSDSTAGVWRRGKVFAGKIKF